MCAPCSTPASLHPDPGAGASQDLVRVIRFCDKDRPETLWSPDSQFKNQSRTTHTWNDPGVTDPAVLQRALAHMDGATANSPFVSVALDEAALLEYGHSGGLRDIMFGVEDASVRAPSIGTFLVPKESLVTPDLLANNLPGARSNVGLMRARKETECLYFGDDLGTHVSEWKDNPHDKAEFAGIEERHRRQMAEVERVEGVRFEAQLASSAARPGQLSTAKVRGDLDGFKESVARLKTSDPGLDTTAVDALHPGTNGLALGRTVRTFDAAVLENPSLKQGWLESTAKFR